MWGSALRNLEAMNERRRINREKVKWGTAFETGHNHDTTDRQFLEDARNSVEVEESLLREMDVPGAACDNDLTYDPADPESDCTGEWIFLSPELDCHSIFGDAVLRGC